MRHFQALLLVLLTAITIELGLLVVKSPTSAVQAQTRIPTPPAMQDPHDLIRVQLDRIQSELVTVERELAATRQQMAGVTQKVNDDSKRLLVTCHEVAQMAHRYGNLPPTRPQVAAGPCTGSYWEQNPPFYGTFNIPFGQ